jgi:Uma2 family endonuclease
MTMSTAAAPGLVTTEELLNLPQNGTDRWLIRGQLRQKPMTVRNRFHSRAMVVIATELECWNRRQPEPRGVVFCGEVGMIIRHDPDTTMGIDVAYVAPDVATRNYPNTTLIDGVPVLAIEILSPSDTQKETHERLNEYLRAGVALVWIVDPADRTVRVYSPTARPQLYNEDQEIGADPHLPGFCVAVRRLFE